MKPHFSNIPVVMQRAKELREKFSALRTEEAFIQGRYLSTKGTVQSVSRSMADGSRKEVFFFSVNKRMIPLAFRRKGEPLTPRAIVFDRIPIPVLASPEGFSGIPLTDTKSIGIGVPRPPKAKAKKDCVSDRDKPHWLKTLYSGSRALILEYVNTLKSRIATLSPEDAHFARLTYELKQANRALDFNSWLKIDTDTVAVLEGKGRACLKKRLRTEAQERKPEVTISGEYRRYTLKEKSKKNRQARRQAAAKAKNAPRK